MHMVKKQIQIITKELIMKMKSYPPPLLQHLYQKQ